MISVACAVFPLDKSHLGLSGRSHKLRNNIPNGNVVTMAKLLQFLTYQTITARAIRDTEYTTFIITVTDVLYFGPTNSTAVNNTFYFCRNQKISIPKTYGVPKIAGTVKPTPIRNINHMVKLVAKAVAMPNVVCMRRYMPKAGFRPNPS